jgi:amino acid transporter
MNGLKRSLGLMSATFFGIGMILGAGIYSVIGPAAGEAGHGLWISLLLSAAVALITGLSYAELATMYPNAGGEYIYLKESFPKPRWLSFFIGLVVAGLGAATAAAVAIGFAGYFDTFFDSPPSWSAFTLLIVVSLINILGIRESSVANILFTIIEASGLILVIYVAVVADIDLPDEVFSIPDSGILSGAALVFFSYLGFENIVNLAEEIDKPERNLPRAIFISITVTSILYVAIGLAAVTLASPEDLARSDAPLADILKSQSTALARSLTVIALFATANTALISCLTASRVLYAMSRAADLPKGMGRVLERTGTPWMATIAVLAVASVLLLSHQVKYVASVASLASLIIFAIVHVTVIVQRFRNPTARRPFRVPLAIGKVPVLPSLGVGSVLVLMTQFERDVYLACLAAVFAGAVSYFFWRGRVRESR